MCSHVREVLSKLRKAKRKIDVVYVSHVDNDHITGVLQLLQDELEWRIHDHKVKTGLNNRHRQFQDRRNWDDLAQRVSETKWKSEIPESIESLLAAAVPTFNGTGVKHLKQAASELGELAMAVKEGVKVSHLVSPDLLDIPVNKLPNVGGKAKLLMLSDRARRRSISARSN